MCLTKQRGWGQSSQEPPTPASHCIGSPRNPSAGLSLSNIVLLRLVDKQTTGLKQVARSRSGGGCFEVPEHWLRRGKSVFARSFLHSSRARVDLPWM